VNKFPIILIGLVVLINGCGTPSAIQSAAANSSKFVALGSLGSRIVQCTALRENTLPDGRLQVRANIMNLGNKRVDLQVNCIFKDEQGFPTGDETPYRTMTLDDTAQETITFTSLNTKAKNYTVRARLARLILGHHETTP
jgi:uncharacterized protein YcfL|tara:strand:- start:190 stop:609 length:420 start_codon:yes stop_codon:yes gene_type:complete